jgi:hypothetical protein
LGQDIINPATQKGGRYDETAHIEKSYPQSSQTVQLDRSPAGS